VGFSNDFLDIISKAQTTKAEIDKREYIKLTAQLRKQSTEKKAT